MDKKYSDIAVEELEKNIARLQEQVRKLKAGCIEGRLESVKTTHEEYTAYIELMFYVDPTVNALATHDLLGKNCRITIEPLE